MLYPFFIVGNRSIHYGIIIKEKMVNFTCLVLCDSLLHVCRIHYRDTPHYSLAFGDVAGISSRQ